MRGPSMRGLEGAGYVEIRNGHVGKRSRTWLALTSAGRSSLARHVTALQEIVAAAQNTAAGTRPP